MTIPYRVHDSGGANCNGIPVSKLQDVDYKRTKSKTVLTTYTQRKKLYTPCFIEMTNETISVIRWTK